MSDANNVTVGKPKIGGAVFNAPVGTALPKSVTEQLDTTFKDLGYCSEDGVTNNNSPEGDSIKAWGGQNVFSYQSGKPDTFKFKLIESINVDVLKTIYGDDNVSGDLTTGITIKANDKELEEMSWVIDMILRDNVLKRIVVPNAKITEIAEIKYADEDAVGYEITLTATPDGQSNTHYEYIQKVTSIEDLTRTISTTEEVQNGE